MTDVKRKLFWGLCLGLLFCVGGYIFFVQSSILYAISLDGTRDSNASLSAKASHLESEYYRLSQNVSLNTATSMGLVERNNGIYLRLDSSAFVASYGGQSRER